MRTFALSFLLLWASFAFAQTQQDRTASQTADTSGQKIQGCLSGSAGSYTLTDSSGQTYQLAGDTSKLGDNVGKKVEITGTVSSPSSSANPNVSPSNPSGSSSAQVLNVSSVQQIADSCGTAR